MNKPELDVRIMGEWDPQELERRIKEFKKENIVEFSQFQPVAIKDEKGKDGVFFTIAMFWRPRETEGIIEGAQIPEEEKPGSNNSPVWMDCPKCKKLCLPFKFDACRCGHVFTKEDKKLFKGLLAADGSGKKKSGVK